MSSREVILPRPKPVIAGFTGTVQSISYPTVDVALDRDAAVVSCQVVTGALTLDVGSKVFLCRFGRKYIVLGVIGEPSGSSSGVPVGSIIMWSGAITAIPVGWALCDGQNGTPDLRDRFILGAGVDAEVGDTGGNHVINLSVDQLPAHSHSASTNTTGNHNHTGRWRSFSISSGSGFYVVRRVHSSDSYDGTDQITHVADGNHTHTVSVGNTGSGADIDIRPKYFKLAFIIKV